MNLEFNNCPHFEMFDAALLPKERPGFLDYKPDFEGMKRVAAEFEEYKNILVIAHGGSVTSFLGYYHALKEKATKKAYFLSTTDPDYIWELKNKLKPADTLVIAISKSGETVTQIEALMQFVDYPLLMITGNSSTLKDIGEKLNAKIVTHPIIGGRYTGLTEVALLPAAICGLDAEAIYNGAKKVYDQYGQDNQAWHAASVLYQLEQNGYADVFMPFYSHNLFPISNLIVQLCHESFGKSGRGQSYFAHEAPESQHHTNQRFFGGQKNIAGFFTTLKNYNHPTQNIFTQQVESVQIKGHTLGEINKIPLEKTIEFEAQGTIEDAKINSIPLIHMSVEGFNPEAMGELVAFWQLYAVYASVLRSVNPFDQPQVESSKNISFNKRLAYKGLL